MNFNKGYVNNNAKCLFYMFIDKMSRLYYIITYYMIQSRYNWRKTTINLN